MNHSTLKKFAAKARVDLIDQVGARLQYVLSSDSVELRERAAQVKQLREALKLESEEALIERVAYTWFNRLAALRFMDAADRHPFGCRVVTATPGNTQPELLQQARNGSIPEGLRVDARRMNDLFDGRVPSSDPQAEVYQMLIVAVCNFYHQLMPFVFEKIADYTELLLPVDLLSEASLANGFRTAITDEDCQEVELIGWLYQYYIAEKKDAVMARKKAVPKEDIPAVTQLFTPHWIVRYMVENSLGRLWMQSRPNSRLRERMEYYIDDASSEVASGQGLGAGGVASGQGLGASEKDYESEQLQRSDRVAESDASGYGGLPGDQAVSQGRALRPDEPSEASGSVDSVKHSGRTSTEGDGGVQELPLDSSGVVGGSGDTTTDRQKPAISFRVGTEASTRTSRGDRQNAQFSDQQASHQPLATQPLTVSSPEEIRLIDPACGSGHILTYAFDLLYAIYEEEGYEPSSIPGHILTKNLHGVEIDERAAELAYFALMMKAQQLSKRFLRKQLRAVSSGQKLVTSEKNLAPSHYPLVPNICCLEEIHFEEGELKAYMDALDIGELFTAPVLTLMHQFEDAKNLGSLIQPIVDDVAFLREAIVSKDLGGELFLRETHRKVETVLRQAEMLAPRYHCAVANPPYMGGRYMTKSLKAWAEASYPDSKSDTYALFIQKCQMLTVDNGFFSLITMQSWMFLQSYGALRQEIFSRCSLTSMFHTGPGVFPDLGSYNVLTTTFVFRNHSGQIGSKALFIKANENPDLQRKKAALNDPKFHFLASVSGLMSVPDFPLVYWLSHEALQNFVELPLLGDVCPSKQGLATGDNGRFVRMWFELAQSCIGFKIPSRDEARKSGRKWFPYNKGGNYRKWYGNNECVVDWSLDGRGIRENYDENGKQRSRPQNTEFYFKRGIVYSLFGFENFGVRFKEDGFVFDVSGSSMFPKSDLEIILAFLCSNVAFFYLKALAPTVNFQVGDLARLPLPKLENKDTKQEVIDLAKSSIELCRADWDAWETSWGFASASLLLVRKESLQSAWEETSAEHGRRRSQLRRNEERINEILIDEYNVIGEVSPEVVDRDLSIKHLDRAESLAAFISYAIGCMFGRYSLDKPGLILANAGETLADFVRKVRSESEGEQISFMPDEDNIIPVLDGEWFEDDIVARFREFLKVTFGEATLRENLQFIEESLGKDLRKYLVSDFYKDHLQTYKKRPIYWLFQSPKKSFQALIYLHRYNRDTVNRLLNDYLREFQNKLQNRRQHLNEILASESTSARDKTAATKEQAKIDKSLTELADWERDVILPFAQQRLEIDLDDGVKQNYPKFGPALAKIPGVS